MKKIIIKESDSNIKVKKYLSKLLPNCSISLLYKLIRKKYFRLNDIYVKGDEVLKIGDVISIFLADETYDSFVNHNKKNNNDSNIENNFNIDLHDEINRIIYEDDNIIIYDKIEGELSQKNDKNTISINEILNYYLQNKGFNSSIYKPSVINRLDINTRGLIIFCKTYIASNVLSKLFKDQSIKKYYFTFVNGIINKDKDILYGDYIKDNGINKAYITLSNNIYENKDNLVITEYEVLKKFSDYTAVNVRLITGKSHQIRAHFSAINHPLICDKKYMDEKLYMENKHRFKRSYQDLICYKIVLPYNEELNKIGLSNKEFIINYGDIDKYEKI